jgi:RNA polymerase sigma-70 factor (ECF subfamily)
MESSWAAWMSGRAEKRSETDVDAILREARPWMYRLALAITAEPERAEDAAQDALVRAARSRDKLRSVDEPKAWLRTVLVRCALTAISSRERGSQAEPAVAPDPTDTIAVRQTLDRLEPMDRAVLALAHFEGLSYLEIASALEIPTGTVGSRLHNARDAFRKEWQK